MLVLTRRVGEAIVIDGDIRITVALVQGEKVRLGITAPDWVRVDRQEVHDRRALLESEPDPETRIRPARSPNAVANASLVPLPEALLVRSGRGTEKVGR
jgi:carbon storage regulator CsrA